MNCEQVYCLVFLLKAKEALDKIKLPIISYGLYTTNNKIMLWITQEKDTTVIMQYMKKIVRVISNRVIINFGLAFTNRLARACL